jgi:hypothetical protein
LVSLTGLVASFAELVIALAELVVALAELVEAGEGSGTPVAEPEASFTEPVEASAGSFAAAPEPVEVPGAEAVPPPSPPRCLPIVLPSTQ